MNIVTGILSRELLSITDKLNIIWMPTDNKEFTEFISDLGHNLLSHENLYFGYHEPHIIICNNKLYQFSECLSISLKYHLPCIIVDHIHKHNLLDSDKIDELNNLPCSYKIAINQNIYNSWNKIHDIVLGYKIKNNQDNIDKWQNILYQSAKRIYSL